MDFVPRPRQQAGEVVKPLLVGQLHGKTVKCDRPEITVTSEARAVHRRLCWMRNSFWPALVRIIFKSCDPESLRETLGVSRITKGVDVQNPPKWLTRFRGPTERDERGEVVEKPSDVRAGAREVSRERAGCCEPRRKVDDARRRFQRRPAGLFVALEEEQGLGFGGDVPLRVPRIQAPGLPCDF